MIDIGIFHPFTFTDSVNGINVSSVLHTPYLNCVISGTHPTIQILQYGTNAAPSSGLTITPISWSVEGQAFSGHLVAFSVPQDGKFYYLKIGSVYSYNVVSWSACVNEIKIEHDCLNQHLDWTNGRSLQLLLPKLIEMPPIFESEDKLIVSNNGVNKKTINQIQRKRVQFVGVPGLVNYMNAIKLCNTIEINSQNGYVRVKNLQVSAEEQNNGSHYIYEITYENYDSQLDTNDCCETINLNDIIAPDVDTSNPACTAFSVAVSVNVNTLTATLANTPPGAVFYKWFKDSVFISSASSITITSAGDYRVDVSVGSCKKSAYYYRADVCEIFKLDVTVVNNIINATTSNNPGAVTWKVLKGGTQVATSVPYTATAPDTYFVEASSGSCKKIKGVVISELNTCNYSLSITDLGASLQAVTSANSPSYLWELETSTGKVTVGTSATIPKGVKGIYWLTVTSGSCTKTVYKYFAPTAAVICSTLTKSTGTVFTIPEIDLLAITHPGVELEIIVNSITYTYVSSTPTLQNNYSINSVGQLIFANSFALNNATIRVLLR